MFPIPRILGAIVFASVFCTQAFADMLIVPKAMTATTIAEIYIEKSHIRVELEIGFKDLPVFANLLPDTVYAKFKDNPIAYKQRIENFIKNDFVITADEMPLKGALVSIKPRVRVRRDDITGKPLKKGNEQVIFAVLEYFYKGVPERITFQPPVDRRGIVNASIGFVTYHLNTAVNDFRFLANKEVLQLDWDDPWYSEFTNKYLWRQNKQAINAFLYIEPFEVRKEIVIRPKDLQRYWIDLGIANKSTIAAKDRKRVKEEVSHFLRDINPVIIDNKIIKPRLDRIHFIQRALTKTNIVPENVDIPLDSAMLGVIYKYPITELPKKVSMKWELWHKDIDGVMSSAIDEKGGLPYLLSARDNVLLWENFILKPSVPSLVSLKPASEMLQAKTLFWKIKNPFVNTVVISNNDAKAILLGLLNNIYHAFDFNDESKTYDVLAKSVSGDLLQKIYLETRQSLILKSQGGAKVKVKKIEINSLKTQQLIKGIGFSVNSDSG